MGRPCRGRAGGPVRRCIRKVAIVFEIASIREWRGQDVLDVGGHKIGELEAVYVDTSTDLPSFGTVQVGMPTRRRLVFVPLNQATVGPGYLKVAYDKKQVKGSPSIGTDGELPAGDEEAVFKHYGLTYQPGGGERQLARRQTRMSGGSDACHLSATGDGGDRAGHRGRGRQGPAVPAGH